MSLNSKQIREIQSLYESVYAPKVENENQVVITHEEFEELCVSILQEVLFQENVDFYLQEGQDLNQIALHENPIKSQVKNTLRQGVMKNLVKPALKKIKNVIIPKTLGGLAVRFGGYEAAKSKPVRDKAGEVIQTGGAIVNNAIPFARDAYHAATTNKTMHGNIMSKVDDKGDRVFTTRPGVKKSIDKITKKNLKNSFEYSNDKFEIFIVEKEEDKNKILNLINQKKEDEGKGKGKTNTNVGGGDGGKKNGNTTPPKNDGVKTDNNLSDKDKSDIKKETDLQKVLNNKKELQKIETENKNQIKDTSNKIDNQNNNKIDTSKEIESDANYAKSNAKFNQRFKDANTDTSNEIESDANYAKSNLRFNRASKGLPPVKRPRVPSPMDMLNPGGVRVKARFKAREAQGLSGLTGKPKFEAYDVVLDYVLSEGHADTLDEAHYVMMQMDENTIQQIIEMSSPYTISQADVNAKTPAFKNYQKGVKNKITGEPLYKLGSGVNLPKI